MELRPGTFAGRPVWSANHDLLQGTDASRVVVNQYWQRNRTPVTQEAVSANRYWRTRLRFPAVCRAIFGSAPRCRKSRWTRTHGRSLAMVIHPARIPTISRAHLGERLKSHARTPKAFAQSCHPGSASPGSVFKTSKIVTAIGYVGRQNLRKPSTLNLAGHRRCR